MAYEFHYTPTGTGVISGKEVLEQTEDAINDLGNTAISGVQEALDKAEQALTNSENAVDDAQTALNTANNAEGVAIQAQNDVSNLSGTVTNIGNRVTTAEGNIDNLQGRMTTAEGNITNLQGRMTTAEGNIGNLQTAVSTAQATANSAQQTATTARQQSYVLRYSSTTLVASSTNSNSLLDNADNLKVGDKVIDASGVIYSVTAIDTANSTFTIGTSLIDLAQDSDVVHKSGNETIGGDKTFNNLQIIGYGTQYKGARNAYILPEFSAGYSGLSITTLGFAQTVKIGTFVLDANNKPSLDSSKGYIQIATGEVNSVNSCILEPRNSTSSSLGTSSNKWGGIYATNYYYGADNTEFSTKFVTTDTAQTVTGGKTFSSNVNVYNSDNTANIPNLYLRNQMSEKGSATNPNSQFILFTDKNNKRLSQIQINKGYSGETSLNLRVETTDNSNNDINSQINYFITKLGTKNFTASANNEVNLGTLGNKWKDVNTYLVNGVEPSSLSLPSDRSARVDISSYFTDTSNGGTNRYTVPANGYIYLNVADVVTMHILAQTSNNLTHYGDTRGRSSVGQLNALLPVRKNDVFVCQWYTTATNVTLSNAYFIPCQGNV